MDGIGEWIRGIVVLIVFVTFLELLVPRSSMQNFIRVVIGLVMLVAILKPVVDLLHGFQPTKIATVRLPTQTIKEIDASLFYRRLYEDGLTQTIKSYLAQQGYKDCEVRIVLAIDNEALAVKKVVISRVGSQADSVRKKVCERFDLARENVSVD